MVKLDLKGSTLIYFALCSEVASLHRIRRLVRAGLVVTLVHMWSSAFGLLGSVLVVTLVHMWSAAFGRLGSELVVTPVHMWSSALTHLGLSSL